MGRMADARKRARRGALPAPEPVQEPAAETRPEARTASSTAHALASVYAISCHGSAPASCKWYEQTLIGFHFGISCAQNVIMSVMSRSDGSGGNT